MRPPFREFGFVDCDWDVMMTVVGVCVSGGAGRGGTDIRGRA